MTYIKRIQIMPTFCLYKLRIRAATENLPTVSNILSASATREPLQSVVVMRKTHGAVQFGYEVLCHTSIPKPTGSSCYRDPSRHISDSPFSQCPQLSRCQRLRPLLYDESIRLIWNDPIWPVTVNTSYTIITCRMSDFASKRIFHLV